jgi:chromate transport protein ChrA
MRTPSIVGPVVLIVIGLIFLLSNLGLIPHIGRLLLTWWPLILIVVGVSMLVERAVMRPNRDNVKDRDRPEP